MQHPTPAKPARRSTIEMVVAVLVLATAYGMLFHVFARVSSLAFGPAGSADPVRDIAGLLLSSFAAAACATALWLWRYRSIESRHALAAGAVSVGLIVFNVVRARGFEGLERMFEERALRSTLSFALAFGAIPLCAFAWSALARRRDREATANGERR